MHEEIGDRICELKREIEALRGELRHSVLREESAAGEKARMPSQIGWTGSL